MTPDQWLVLFVLSVVAALLTVAGAAVVKEWKKQKAYKALTAPPRWIVQYNNILDEYRPAEFRMWTWDENTGWSAVYDPKWHAANRNYKAVVDYIDAQVADEARVNGWRAYRSYPEGAELKEIARAGA